MSEFLRETSHILLAFALIVGALGLGAVYVPVVSVVAVCVALAALGTVAARGERASVSWMALGFMSMGVFAIVQGFSWPLSVTRLLNPVGLGFFEGGWSALFGEPPQDGARPLSVNVFTSADRALRWFTLALVSVAATNVRSSSRDRRLVAAVALAAGATLPIALARRALFADEPSSFFGFVDVVSPISMWTTFVNTNHGAAFFGLGALCAGWLAWGAKTTRARWVWVVTACVCALGVVAIGSLGVFVALASVGIARVAMRHGARSALAASGGVLGACGLAWLVLSEGNLVSMTTRANLMVAAFEASRSFWVAGSGAGTTFFVTVPFGLPWLERANMGHAENQVLEWMLTLGWPVTAACCAMFVAAAWEPVRRAVRLEDGTRARPRNSEFAVYVLAYTWTIAMLHYPFFMTGLGASLVAIAELCSTSARAASPWRARVSLGVCVLGLAGSLAWVHSMKEFTPLEIVGDEPLGRGRLEQLVRERPADVRLFLGEAERMGRQGRWGDATRMFAHARALTPRDRVVLMHAISMQRSGRPLDEVVELIEPLVASDVFDRKSVHIEPILVALPNHRVRAELFENLEPAVLEQVARTVERVEGLPAVCSFLIAMHERVGARADVFVLLVSALRRLGVLDQARQWSAKGREAFPRDAQLISETVRLERQASQSASAYELLWSSIADVERVEVLFSDVFEWWWFSRFDEDAHTDERLEWVLRARQAVCVDRPSSATRVRCLHFSAWEDEREGRLERAKTRYERIARAAGEPSELALFLHRQGRCLELRKLSSTWSARDEAARKAAATTISRLAERCYAR